MHWKMKAKVQVKFHLLASAEGMLELWLGKALEGNALRVRWHRLYAHSEWMGPMVHARGSWGMFCTQRKCYQNWQLKVSILVCGSRRHRLGAVAQLANEKRHVLSTLLSSKRGSFWGFPQHMECPVQYICQKR